MKWKKGACLLTAVLISVSNVSYAEEADNNAGTIGDFETESGVETPQDDADNDTQDIGREEGQNNETEPFESQEDSSVSDNERVIWGRGRGITSATLESDDDQFSTLPVI